MAEPTRIVRLSAENVKRLRAVEIVPDGSVVVISGRNGQGKTSVLDSIAFALGGAKLLRTVKQPIREGAERAKVELDMGDYTVTRYWDEAGTRLAVMAKDGARYPSPQKFLDERLGALSFDPLAFTRKTAKEQVSDLIQLIDLPFDPLELEAERQIAYGTRTGINRQLASLHGQLDGVLDAPDDADEAEVSVAQAVDELRVAEAAWRAYDDATAALYQARERISELERDFDNMKKDLARLSADIATRKGELAAMEAAYEGSTAALPVVAELDRRLERVEAENAVVRERNRQRQTKRDLASQIVTVQGEHDRWSSEIDAIDKRKRDALADAQMPVEGLSFDAEGVTYRGVPFAQCSSAEQLRVSLAMAMAMNPTIGVVRITDGSLLDTESMELVRAMAETKQMQVWIERVSDGEGVGFTIEDGSIR